MNAYARIVEALFWELEREGSDLTFNRERLRTTAQELGIDSPKNLGDVVYGFNYCMDVPPSMTERVPKNRQGKNWIIRHVGKSEYKFALGLRETKPNPHLVKIKIPDATPGIIFKHALNDEQALLAKIRYNRLIDIFTGVTCYSLQNHMRTSVEEMG